VKHSPIVPEEALHTDTIAKDAFIRDELSKGRYDPAIAGICFQMLLELYTRVLRSDLGPSEATGELEHVC
jgi:carboxymethylenebutenolidase